MYCPQCGAANDNDASACGSCSFDLNKYREQWREDAPSGAGAAAGSDAGAAADGASGYAAGAATGAAAGAAAGTASGAAGGGSAPYAGSGYQYPSSQPYQGQPYQSQPYQSQPYQSQPYQSQPYQGPPYQQTPYPAGYQGPPYAPYAPQRPYGQVPHIPTYLGWAIAVFILCFWPTGIVALVYASQVNNKLVTGDYAGAQHSSHMAKVWCWVSFGIAIAFIVLAIIGVIIAVAVAGSVHVQGVISQVLAVTA
jgi:hypothetical protein